MLTLIADRFVRDADGRVLDLATGERVTLVETTLRTPAEQRARHDACRARLEASPPDGRAPGQLVDFALVGEWQWIEAYREPPLVGDGDCHAMAPAERSALDGVVAALDSLRAGDVRRLYVKSARVGQFTAFAETVAREARSRGFVPVSPTAVERWPAAVALLRLRSVLLLGIRPAHTHALARVLVTLTRAVASIVGIVVRVAERVAVAALRLPGASSDRDYERLSVPLGVPRGVQHDASASAAIARVAEPVAVSRARGRVTSADFGRAYPITRPDAPEGGRTRRRPAPSSPWSRGSLAIPVMTAEDEEIEESAMEGSDAECDAECEAERESPTLPIVTTTMTGYGAAADALVRRGRWAAACRRLRSELAAHDRREASAAAARASLALGRVFLAQADLTNAARWLDHAGERAARAGDARLIAEVLRWSGVAALDGADLERSERLLRTALAAAGPAADPRQALAIDLTLARCLFWQGRFDEIVVPTLDRLPAVVPPRSPPDDAVREASADHPLGHASEAVILRVAHWRLVARLAMLRGELSRAGDALARACRLARGDAEDDVRSGACHVDHSGFTRARDGRGSLARAGFPLRHALYGADADLRVICHLDAARLQLAIGDWAGCDLHLRECLALPRAAARTRRIQVLQLARLRGDRRIESRRQVERLSAALRQAHVSPLIRIRARYLVEPRSRRAGELTTFLERHGEAPLTGRAAGREGDDPPDRDRRGGSPMLDAFQAVLQICHETPDDLAALGRVCTFLRDRLQAAHVAVHGAPLDRGRLAFAGSSRLASPELVARVIDSGLMMPPTYRPDALDAAVPIRYQNQTVGALVARWIVDATIDQTSAAALLSAAAAALAPQVRAVLDRQPPPEAATAAAGSSSSSSAARTLGLLGVSTAIETLRQTIGRAASAPFHVLIQGESGSGKELVARALHHHGPRRHRRFCAINCAALTDELLEAELFGHTRGAFTGALTERAGLFEEADHGTLFLDEIGELSARGQAKLLRVIQDGETRRIGENLPRRVDARIVAATNRALRDEVAAGQFRADLLYRLDVIRIVVPPLRARPEDVAILARAFWADAASRTGSRATLDPDTLAALARYHWPGNVRELQNAIMALAVHAPARGRVPPSLLPPTIRARPRRAAGDGDRGTRDGSAPVVAPSAPSASMGWPARSAAWEAGAGPPGEREGAAIGEVHDDAHGDEHGDIDDGASERDASPRDSPSDSPYPVTLDVARREFESRFVLAALTRAGGHTARAPQELGLTREGLRRLMLRLGLHAIVARTESAATKQEPERSEGG